MHVFQLEIVTGNHNYWDTNLLLAILSLYADISLSIGCLAAIIPTLRKIIQIKPMNTFTSKEIIKIK